MIAPEGYIPVSSLISLAIIEKSDELESYLRFLYQNEGNFISYRPMDVLSRWILEFCEHELSVVVEDRIWNLDANILNNSRVNLFNFPVSGNDVPARLLREFAIADDLGPENISSSDFSKIKHFMMRIYVSVSPLVFIKIIDFSIDFSLLDFIYEFPPNFDGDDIKWDVVRKNVEFAEGKPLFVSKAHFNSNWETFWSGRGDRQIRRFTDAFDEEISAIDRGAGRPSLKDDLLQAYNKAFPNGRADFTWSQVYEAVLKEYNKPFHLDTLKRHLGKR